MQDFVRKFSNIIFFMFIFLGLGICISEPFSRNLVRIIFVLMVVALFINRDLIKLTLKYKKFLFLMGAFFLWMLISFIYSGKITSDPNYLTYWFFFNHNMLLFLAIGILILEEKQLRAIIFFIGISLTIDNIYVLSQIFNKIFRPELFLHGGSMQGTMVYVILLPLFLVLILNKADTFLKRLLGCIFFLLTFVSFIFMHTRGAWLSLLIVLTFVLVYYIRDWKKLISIFVIFSLTVTAVLISSPKGTIKRIRTFGNITNVQSVTERFLMWQSAVNVIKDHPIIGVGLGNYPEKYQNEYILPQAKERDQGHSHNVYLQFWAETGLPGLITFLSMFSYFLYWSWRRRKSIYGMMLFTSTLALMLYGLTDYIYTAYGAMRIYWLILGICIRGVELDGNFKKINAWN